jgi:adenylate cyclase
MVPRDQVQRRLAAILAADVAGYSRLMEADEAGTLARLKAVRREVIDPSLAEYRGRLVKLTGDGALVEFASTLDAVQCALAIQESVAERMRGEAPERRITFRIGINVGDVIVEGDDVYGAGVNVAARLEGLCEPGAVCVSGDVYRQVRGKVDGDFADLGEQRVKNIAEPIRAYRLSPKGASRTGPVQEKRLRWRAGMVAAAVVLAAAVGGLALWQPWAPRVVPASVELMAYPLPDKPAIAVLPFANLSGNEDQEYFADGLTEDLITNLASFPNLFVIARNSSATYKGQAVDIRDVAHDLGVQYVVEGSVRRDGETVRITAQLIDALSGSHVWADSYDRELKDIFALYDEITAEIGSRLVSKVAEAEFQRRTRRGTTNAEAYDLFLRGSRYAADFNPRANARAIALLEQAIEKDPGFARAYAFLAFVRRNNAILQWADGPEDTLDHALELAQKSVGLDSRDSATYRTLSRVYTSRGEFVQAIEAAEQAVALSPSDPDTLMVLAFALVLAGRANDAIGYAEAALRLNPHAPWWYDHTAGMAYYLSRQFDRSLAAIQKARDLNPRAEVLLLWAAAAHAQLGNLEAAQSLREEYMALRPGHRLGDLSGAAQWHPVFADLFFDGLRKAGFQE